MNLRALVLLILIALPVQAETDAAGGARLAAQNLRAAIEALDTARAAHDQVQALTQTLQAYEQGLDALRDGLRRASIREQALSLRFKAKRERVAQLVGVMTAMQSAPGPALLLHPDGPLGTARSGMILSAITPALQAEAEALRAELEEVALLRQLQQSAVDTLADGLRAVQEARTALSQAIAERTDLPSRIAESPAELQTLLESVDTLDSFADLLSDTRIEPADTVFDFEAAKGSVVLPVLGTLLRGYQQADAAGIRRPGILLATRPRALVTTPWPVTIRYRGPLLDYGNVMILEPGGGYLLVLAGLDLVYGEVGDVLPQGTPVGLMGGTDSVSTEFVAETKEGGGEDRTETLYLELRQAGAPVDPTEWFTETRE